MDVSRGMLVFFFFLKQETNVRVKFELGFVLVKSDAFDVFGEYIS